MSAVVLALPLVAAGGGSASAATQTPQQFEAHQIAWLAGGQYRKVYEALYPPQRAHLSYQRFAACAKEASGLPRASASTGRPRGSRARRCSAGG
jgi:hypothetical protein